MVDRSPKAMGKDPLAFRREFVRDDRMRAVLDKVAEVGNWGRAMPAGHRAGPRRPHASTRATCACLVEIDCRPADGQPQDPPTPTPGRA